MKRCSRCGENKPQDAFYRSKGKRDGLHNQCKACQTVTAKTYYDAKGHATQRAWWLHKKYGITEEARSRLLEWSNGGCSICGARPEDSKLDVDHDHKTGKVRGILCRSCNLALGMLKDDKRLLHIAIAYLDYFDDEPDT